MIYSFIVDSLYFKRSRYYSLCCMWNNFAGLAGLSWHWLVSRGTGWSLVAHTKFSRMFVKIVLLCLILTVDGNNEPDEMIKQCFREVLKEYNNSDCTVLSGVVPDWIDGYLLCQTCGSFGDIDTPDHTDELAHWLDCLGMAATYTIQNGHVTFSSRYYDTRSYNIWNQMNRDMKQSKVAWKTIFSPYDAEQAKHFEKSYSDMFEVEPTVTFWQLGTEVLAVTETTTGMHIDLPTLTNLGPYPYKDENLGAPPGSVFINNAAHEHVDTDGTFWSVTGMFQFTGQTSGLAKIAAYTIQQDTRNIVGTWEVGAFDLTLCDGGEYPDLEQRPPYMHVFGLTENYIILFISPWLFDYCHFFVYGKPEPLLKHGYNWHGEKGSKFVVMEKKSGKVIGELSAEAHLMVHMVNAFEQDGAIHIDGVVYDDSRVLDTYTFIQRIIRQMDPWESHIYRFTLSLSEGTVTRTTLTRDDPVIRDFPMINYKAVNGRPYTYAYFVERLMKHNSSIVKLNVKSREELVWKAPPGVFPQEPQFVQNPGTTDEDNGLLLVTGSDSRHSKGFMVILRAQDLSEVAYVLAPERTLIGIHSKYISRDSLRDPNMKDEL